MRRTDDAGLYAEELHRGTLVNGKRVETMTRGRTVAGQKTITVRFAETDRRGRKRTSDPVTYLAGQTVPGTRRPTTWAMPAGPVGRRPGVRQNGGWYGDGDATDRGSRADRHQRRMEALTYAY